MLQPRILNSPPIVPLKELQLNFSHQLLEQMQNHIDYSDNELKNGFQFEVKIRKTPNNKVNPILRLANPDDAETIVSIVKEDYEGTYPYKEMEDPNEVRNMIKSGKYKFVLFLNNHGEIIGTTCFVLYLKEKTGYPRTFVVKKKWLGVLDATKAYVASFVAICNSYKDEILLWWGEARTADAKSQYINRLCSLRPIGFLPNKDFFYNRVESDLIMASYTKEMFRNHRSKKKPKIIPEIANCYEYSNYQYNLGEPKILNPNLNYSQILKNAKFLRNNIVVLTKSDKFNYITYKMTLVDGDSYFKFIYTPRINNFEKVEYKVKSLEELVAFIQSFNRIGQNIGIRYKESYVSAYNPSHQKIFNYLGFTPRGYLPAWNLNKKTNKFEDYIVFNWYRKPLVKYETIPEGLLLLKHLNIIPK